MIGKSVLRCSLYTTLFAAMFLCSILSARASGHWSFSATFASTANMDYEDEDMKSFINEGANSTPYLIPYYDAYDVGNITETSPTSNPYPNSLTLGPNLYGLDFSMSGEVGTSNRQYALDPNNPVTMTITATWIPDNNNISANPAPSTVSLTYKRHIIYDLGVAAKGGYPAPNYPSSVQLSIEGWIDALHCPYTSLYHSESSYTASSADSGVVDITDPSATTETLTVSGSHTVSKTFTLSWEHRVVGVDQGVATVDFAAYYLVDVSI